MFGGAYSATYDVAVRHSVYGLIDCRSFPLDVSSTVTAVNINSISLYGGTRFTIQGTNFGSEFTDNPVQLSYNGGVGSTDCLLESISET